MRIFLNEFDQFDCDSTAKRFQCDINKEFSYYIILKLFFKIIYKKVKYLIYF